MSRPVVVLGIHDGHNAGAALLRDGQIVAGVQEERLNNIKNYSGPPLQAIKKVFEIAKIHPSELSLVAIAGLLRTHAPIVERPIHVRFYENIAFAFKGHRATQLLVSYLHKFRKFDEVSNALRSLGILKVEISFVEHHVAHAASAYFTRPWDDGCLVLTLDGAGDGLCSSVSVAEGGRMVRVASTTAYNSPANVLYSEITGYLGMKRWEHEYKVMGLAPYGNEEYCLDKIQSIVRVNPRTPLEFENTSGRYLIQIQGKLQRMLAEQRFDNIAAATQRHFEDIVCQWIKGAIEHTGRTRVVCAGGAFLNVKANKRIRELPEVRDSYFYPAASDEGTAIGAAYQAYVNYCSRMGFQPSREAMPPLYNGESFYEETIADAIKRFGLQEKAELIDDIDGTIAELLAKNKIVARFEDRGEWGPRALGNRSILADPRDPRVVRRLNTAIKHRDFWMPFAPSILDSRMDDYLIRGRFSPYMIEAFDTTIEAEELTAALHPQDRTARPQIVNSWNEGYRRVLLEFDEQTGVGGLLNTSFNLHGYPIVGTVDSALWTFMNSELDAAAIGGFLVSK